MKENKVSKINKRSVLLVLALTLVVAIVSISFTLAFLSDQRVVTNTFSFGEITIQVLESKWTTPAGEAKVVAPGQTVNKDPSVKNVGSMPCYVRATITISDAVLNSKQDVLDFIEMGALSPEWKVAENQTWGGRQVTVYYQQELPVGGTTTPIFNTVTLKAQNASGQALLEGPNNNFAIDVIADAVQTTANGYTITSAEDAFAQLM
ncbi:hypothetical protein LJC61_03815 [Ruminococcaceae bacterium OttesenSCG-928-A16]|nr:hypothetical protein [Ruminococcaceae bacterium OttesenSCG-928-A16]